MNAIRWQIFKWLSALGWAICPEPQKSVLQDNLLSWKELEEIDIYKRAVDR